MTKNHEYLSDEESKELRRVFYAQAYELLEDMQESALRLEAFSEDDDALKALQRHFHTLKGDSKAVGLPNVATICHRVEDILTSFSDKTRHIDSEAIGVILSCVDTIDSLLRLSESGKNGGDIGKTMEMIDAFLGSSSDSINADAKFIEYQHAQIDDAVKSGMKLYKAEIVFHPMCAERGVGALMLNQRFNSIGQIINSNPDLTSNEVEGSERMSVVFSSNIDIDIGEIREKLLIAGVTGEVNVVPYTPPPKGISADKATGIRLKSEILTVQASKVDTIMNLVGELIIGRSIIDQIGRDVESGRSTEEIAPRLFAVNSYMERTVSDLQKGIMKMRMVPINHVFRKFPRVVRELAGEKGKQVRLDIYGRDKELDKGIVDALSEPLVHIIRNSIDHGIEEPGYRKSVGKPEEGVIALGAYHESAQIVIEVSDDGRGIDTKRLREKAIEKGFLKPEEVKRLSDSETINLIFLSGLSTSETVSDVSGRGIGMDAVKTAVESMKGTIEVESSPDKGTKLRLRLPLTLAIIKALLFDIGGRLYAIPISAISEVTRIMKNGLATIDGKDTLLLREKIISIIHLNKLFGTQRKDNEKKFAMILSIGDRKVGLLADYLMGQQELVIKAVNGNYAKSEFVAGASILGDGRVVLILDVPGLFKKAVEAERKRMELVEVSLDNRVD